ncbi:MAG: LapA family protein [Thermoleophilia bacterium]|jgi:uncharacterized integral membrane protein
MSATQQPQVQLQRESRGGGWGKLIVLVVLFVVLLIYIVQNGQDVPVDFLVWSFTWPAWLLFILMLGIGFLAGLATGAVLRRRRKRDLRRRANSL